MRYFVCNCQSNSKWIHEYCALMISRRIPNISWCVKHTDPHYETIAFGRKLHSLHCGAPTFLHTGLQKRIYNNLLSQFLKQLVFLCKACAGDGCHPGSVCVSSASATRCEDALRSVRQKKNRNAWSGDGFSLLEKWSEGKKKRKKKEKKNGRSFSGCCDWLLSSIHIPSLPWQQHPPPPLLTCSHTWSHADSKAHPHTFSAHHTVLLHSSLRLLHE